VKRFPKLLYFDVGFAGGVPRQYYISYGLTADGLLLWLRKQLASLGARPPAMPPCATLGDLQCASGLCVPEARVCDGAWDCGDGADETMCQLEKQEAEEEEDEEEEEEATSTTTEAPQWRPNADGEGFYSLTNFSFK